MLRNTGEEDEEVANGGTGGPGDARISGLATVLLQEYDADSLREGDKVPTCSIRTHSALRPPTPYPNPALQICLGELRRFPMHAFSTCASGILYMSAGSVGMHTRGTPSSIALTPSTPSTGGSPSSVHAFPSTPSI